MGVLPLVFTTGWASGVNAYATVLVLGLLGRFGGFAEVPQGLQRTDVLIVAGVLTLIEFFADKIPYVDSFWDAISTVIRPVAGAVIGALIAGNQVDLGEVGDLTTVTLASVGGVTALVSHLVRASLRLAVNTSPEPASNVIASAGGEIGVVGLTTLAVLHPIPAAIIVGIVLIAGIVLAFVVGSRIRRGWKRLRQWRRGRLAPDVQ